MAAVVYKIAHESPPAVQRLNPTLGWPVEQVIRRALEKGPAARFSTCAEFASALEASCKSSKGWKPLPRGASQSLPTVAAEVAAEAPAPTPPPEMPRETGRKKVMVGLLATLAVIVVMALSVTWLVGRRPVTLGEQPPAEQDTAPAGTSRPSPAGRPTHLLS